MLPHYNQVQTYIVLILFWPPLVGSDTLPTLGFNFGLGGMYRGTFFSLPERLSQLTGLTLRDKTSLSFISTFLKLPELLEATQLSAGVVTF